MELLRKNISRGIPDSLLAKYVVNETTDIESGLVEEWIAADEKNGNYVEGLFTIIQKCGQMQEAPPESEEAAWESFWQSTKNSKSTATPVRWLSRNARWISVAAILLLVIGAAVIFYLVNSDTVQPAIVMKEIHGDGIRTDTLPDGSLVLISKHATLVYPSSFAGSQRDVELKGTCYFSVAHSMNKPFRIKVKDILVTVVGTSFTIQSDWVKTDIQVHTGIVEVTKRNHSLRLFQGDKMRVLTTDTVLIKESFDTIQPVKKVTVAQQIPAKKGAIISTDEVEKQKRIVKNIISDIVTRRIVPEKDSIEWFGLTDNEFIVNGIKQPESIFVVFRNKYPVKPDYGFYYGPVQMIGTGAFISKEDINQ